MRLPGIALFASLLIVPHIHAAEQRLVANAGAGLDELGYSVAISEGTIVAGSLMDFVGPNAEQGSATIFTRNENGWSEQTTLLATDGAAHANFGFSVAIDADTVAVGAFKSDLLKGSVYIFVRNGNEWTQQAKLLAGDGEEGDVFGYSVELDGDTLVVGAPGCDQGVFAAYGAAYVFVRNGNTWTQQARLQHADGWTSDNFGLDVAIDGNTIVASSGWADVAANQNQGAAWVFVRNGITWSQQARLTASDAAKYDEFGRSIAISGETILVGSQTRLGANDYQGAAYIFDRSGANWTQTAKLTAPDGAYNDRLGFSVALEGDTAVVGCSGDDLADHQNQGSLYVFTRREGTWSLHAKRTTHDGDTFDAMGYSVAISGDDIAAGVPFDDVGSSLDQGAVQVFSASAAPQQKRRAARK
jgi:hypothetical protein